MKQFKFILLCIMYSFGIIYWQGGSPVENTDTIKKQFYYFQNVPTGLT